jgi:hypothetical protein
MCSEPHLTRDQHRNSPETVPTTNKQIKQQYLHVPRDPDELQPLVQDLVKVVGRGFVSQKDGRANCVERVSRHSGNIVSKQSGFVALQCVCVCVQATEKQV